MLLIHQFPAQPNSLDEIVNDMRYIGLKMNICWFYSESGMLNVAIKMDNDIHYNLLSAWLASKGFLFTTELSDESCFDKSSDKKIISYALKPKQESPDITNRMSMQYSGLLKTEGGRLMIAINAAMDRTNYYVNVETRGDAGVKEISYALGMDYYVNPSRMPVWNYTGYDSILELPYNCQEHSLALTTGYGGKNQARRNPQDNDITIGGIFNDVIDRKLCFTADENLTSSTCIYGAPGYGKSTLISSLICNLWKKANVPFVVIEPKQEYRGLKKLIPELIIRDNESIAKCNPLFPPKGMSYADYIDVFLELIELITPSSSESAHKDYFRDAYFLCLKKTRGLKISDYLKAYDDLMKGRYTGDAVNFSRAGRHKLEAFFTAWSGGKEYLDNNSRIPFKERLNYPMVIEIGNVASTKLKAVYAYYILQQIRGTLRNNHSRKIEHLIVIEEAHMLLDPSAPIEIRREIGNGMAEDRARGVSYIVTDQSPSRLDMTQMGLAGNAISFRLLNQSDRNAVAEQIGVSPESLNNMMKREAWVRLNTMYCPSKIKVEVDEEILNC